MKKFILITLVIFTFSISLFVTQKINTAFFQKKVLGISTIKKENVVFESLPTFDENRRWNSYYSYRPYASYSAERDWLDYEANYSINSQGFNDLTEYSIEKPDNTIRIITLGDSYTFGELVSTEDSWPEQLEKNLNFESQTCKYEVINLGMSGFDIPYIVTKYINDGKKFNPDLVLWFESGSGYTRIKEQFEDLSKDCTRDLNNIDEVHKCESDARENAQNKFGYQEIRNYLTNYLDYFINTVIDNEKLVIFTRKDSFWYKKDKETLESWIAQFGEKALFDNNLISWGQEGILPDTHPNQLGHKVIADYALGIIKRLEKQDCSI